MTEDEILIVFRTMLTVEINVEQLALPESLRNSMNKVESSHLLVTNLWVNSDHLWVIQGVDEGERVADCWKEDISTRLIWLRFDSKLNVVALIFYITTQDIEAFAITLECNIGILRAIRLCAFTAAPANINLCAKFCG